METTPQTFPPWKDVDQWRHIEIFFRHTWGSGCVPGEVKEHGLAIREDISRLDALLSDLCAVTCPSCLDVCCRRATVWYDFKDLVLYYTLHQELPTVQIVKGGGGCMHLTPHGCRLERIRRPFVCTWYLCPQQKALAERQQYSEEKESIPALIERIKSSRRLLERAFLLGVCGNDRLPPDFL